MLSSSLFTAVATVLLASSTLADIHRPSHLHIKADSPVQARDFTPSEGPSLIGCYGSAKGLTFKNADKYQTKGLCQGTCATSLGLTVEAIVNGTDCWCGSTFPPVTSLVDPSNCDTPCPGFGADMCGSSQAGPQFWSVWNSGLKKSSLIPNATADVSSTSTTLPPTSAPTSSKAAATSSVPDPATTPTNTPTATPPPDAGPNKAGIAAGVVVGVLAIAGIIGGTWFFLRSRRRREVEEEYKRQVASRNPGSSAGSSQADTRLDPAIMTQRRLSDGSIMDNQDYSRRILKVTNA